jgi:hypothetical protein
LVCANPMVIASDTNRGCTLSRRSRSMRCRSVCADDTAPERASASALIWYWSAAVGDGDSSHRSIAASTAGAKTRIPAADMSRRATLRFPETLVGETPLLRRGEFQGDVVRVAKLQNVRRPDVFHRLVGDIQIFQMCGGGI